MYPARTIPERPKISVNRQLLGRTLGGVISYAVNGSHRFKGEISTMFCPTCGLAEDRQVQYCRSCGIDLRGVRAGLTSPDAQRPPVNAREEIGRALAARVWGLEDLSELEDALPAIEKFLESPAERRLRRIRAGTICASIGVGATVFFTLFGLLSRDLLFMPGLGIVLFLIGVGLILNGKFLTVPDDRTAARITGPSEGMFRQFSADGTAPAALPTGETLTPPASVTENTTRHLGQVPVDATGTRSES